MRPPHRRLLRRPTVLLYHGFGSRSLRDDPLGMFIPTDRFEEQLCFLTRHFHPLDLSGYLAGLEDERWPPRSFLLTIDDGYVSTLDQAAPLLARYQVPAVLFVSPGLLGHHSVWMPAMPSERLLTPQQLVALSGLGIEVGAHGMDHTVLRGLTAEQIQTQVFESREVLGDILGYLPRSFAYPEGRFDENTVEAVRAAGYDVAFSVHQGDAGPFSVRRRGVNSGDSSLSFSLRLMPWYELARKVSARFPAIRRLSGLVTPTQERP
jgi:peptidoglycan/xylan/chitin deacetylase (PgdA/CDA1 family)